MPNPENKITNNEMVKTPTLTIGVAQRIYLDTTKSAAHSALRSVIGTMIDKDIRTEFENDSYLDALILSEMMFARSVKSVKMLTGDGCDTFLQTLGDSFIGTLKRLQAIGGKMRVLMVATEIPKFISDAQAKFNTTLEVALLRVKPQTQVPHFLVCDSRMARVEKPHGPLTNDTPADAIQASVHFNNPSRSELLESRFDAFWSVATAKTA